MLLGPLVVSHQPLLDLVRYPPKLLVFSHDGLDIGARQLVVFGVSQVSDAVHAAHKVDHVLQQAVDHVLYLQAGGCEGGAGRGEAHHCLEDSGLSGPDQLLVEGVCCVHRQAHQRLHHHVVHESDELGQSTVLHLGPHPHYLFLCLFLLHPHQGLGLLAPRVVVAHVGLWVPLGDGVVDRDLLYNSLHLPGHVGDHLLELGVSCRTHLRLHGHELVLVVRLQVQVQQTHILHVYELSAHRQHRLRGSASGEEQPVCQLAPLLRKEQKAHVLSPHGECLAVQVELVEGDVSEDLEHHALAHPGGQGRALAHLTWTHVHDARRRHGVVLFHVVVALGHH
mmetsp:Transcript_32932/g.72520  ORF Transcript_32932/g.72520 Transcript_32932/m.72520 type:complete len:337 (-) Transcript_32932:380-1390(-)